MSTNPTTASQVQAYRFVLRRMESALVRRDAVMLHEPMRHHLRATAVGLILGVLGLAAFFVLGRLHPTSETLGLGAVTRSAPESILELSPIGLTLDVQRALELFNPVLARQQAE
jgi:hypothetical protein